MADLTSPESLLDGLHSRRFGAGNFFPSGDPRVVSWLREAIEEGESINRHDPAFDKIETAMDFVLGEQYPKSRPSYLPNIVVNQTKKVIRAHVSALTDLRPLFSYRVANPNFKSHSELLNELVVLWWVNTFADLDLADCLKYALTAGTGDMLVEYDPHFNGFGDTRMIPRDPRDLLPIRPSRTRTIQDWYGVAIREAWTPNQVLGQFPDKAHVVRQALEHAGSKGAGVFSRFRRVMDTIVTPYTGALGVLKEKGSAQKERRGAVPEVTVWKFYLDDRQRNLTREEVVMGNSTAAWSYRVKPGDLLYPRKRLILWIEDTTEPLTDGPSPYWHGMYPVERLKLDPWPWLFLGLGLVHDQMPLQRTINDTVNDFLQVFSQWVNRIPVGNKAAVPGNWFRRFDPRRPGPQQKVLLNPSMGEGFKLLDGPQTPPWSMEFLAFMFQKFDELAGTANLQAILNARQVPSADTIQRYVEALTPEIRLEGRLLEGFLRSVGRMVMVNIFQFYNAPRRMTLLGDASLTKQDFDFDPGNLVPAMQKSDPGWTAELDKDRSQSDRAQYFHKLFSFYVSPNSMLAMQAMEQKLLYLQLARAGYVDYWTLLERLEIPNVGDPPPVPLPDLEAQEGSPVPVDPLSGMPLPPPMTIRKPVTITERLMAQQQLGIGMTVSPVGRKASGGAPPQMETKQGPEGPRTTVTESR